MDVNGILGIWVIALTQITSCTRGVTDLLGSCSVVTYYYVLMHIATYLRVPPWFLNRRGCRHTRYIQASAGSQSLQSWKRGASADTTRRCLGSGQPVLLLVDQWRRSPLDYHAQSSSAGLVFWACQRLSPADWPLIQFPSSLACVKSGLPRHCSWSGCPISWFQTPSAP